jgi:2-dehydrotetronate isomerase
MPRFAANLTMLFTEVPALDRAGLAAQAGFDGVEILFPYDHPARDWAASLSGLPVALINAPPGDWAAGDRGHAAVPGMEQAFRDGFLRALDVAGRIGAERIHVMAGVARGPLAEQTYAENLTWALAQAPGMPLVVEPLNGDDMPGYFLNDFDQAGRILADIGSDRIGLQFDLWHAARIHGDAWAVWERNADRVSHVQIAGFPNRAEPGGGGFDLTALFRALDARGYAGWVAAEYRPARATVHGLGWLNALKNHEKLIGQG